MFDLGLPDSVNQLNNSTAASPLNLNQMYWSWSIGYKFSKLEMRATDAGFTTLVHFGSLNCGGDISSNTCSQPFRSQIRATSTSGFNPASNSIVLDMNDALASFDPSTGTRRGCMPLKPPPAAANAEETAECPKLLSNFGLNTDGSASGTQSAFRIQ